MSDDNVIQLPPRKPRIVAENSAPREKFGLRKPWLRADNLVDLSGGAKDAWELATKAPPTRKSLSALAELARAYGGASNHVDASLKTILAAQVDGVASQLAHLSKIAHSYGMLAESTELNEFAGDIEILAAEIHPLEPTDETA